MRDNLEAYNPIEHVALEVFKETTREKILEIYLAMGGNI